jgi:aminopeptidase N
MTHTPQTIYLRDYTVPPYLISTTDLEFDLYDHETIVTSRVHYTRNGASQSTLSDLILHGYGLELISVSIDGQDLTGDQYEATPDRLALISSPEDFVLTTVTRIHPETNTALE